MLAKKKWTGFEILIMPKILKRFIYRITFLPIHFFYRISKFLRDMFANFSTPFSKPKNIKQTSRYNSSWLWLVPSLKIAAAHHTCLITSEQKQNTHIFLRFFPFCCCLINDTDDPFSDVKASNTRIKSRPNPHPSSLTLSLVSQLIRSNQLVIILPHFLRWRSPRVYVIPVCWQ